MTRILVTGGSGFIGRALLERFRSEENLELLATVRRPAEHPTADVKYVQVE